MARREDSFYQGVARSSPRKQQSTGLLHLDGSSPHGDDREPQMQRPIQDCQTFSGTPGGTRTPDLLLRRQLLYPAELLAHVEMERVTGIGPAYPAWKAGVLPLNYTRKSICLTASASKF